MKIIISVVALLFSQLVSAQDSHQALQESFVAAVVANDAAALGSLYAPDAVSFDVGAQRLVGPEAIAKSWSDFFAQFRVLEAALVNPHVETHGDTSIGWGEFTLMVEPVEGGEAFEMKGRYSDVARNFDGQWRYVMDHASVPVPGEDSE